MSDDDSDDGTDGDGNDGNNCCIDDNGYDMRILLLMGWTISVLFCIMI